MKGNSSFRGRDFVVSSFPLYNPGEVTKIVDAFARQVQNYLPSTITTPEWSLIYSAEGEAVELYNLRSDPKQEKNVIFEYPDIGEFLHEKYFSVLESCNVDKRLLEPRKKITIKDVKSKS